MICWECLQEVRVITKGITPQDEGGNPLRPRIKPYWQVHTSCGCFLTTGEYTSEGLRIAMNDLEQLARAAKVSRFMQILTANCASPHLERDELILNSAKSMMLLLERSIIAGTLYD